MSGDADSQETLALEMFAQAMQLGQSARAVEPEDQATALREALRRLGRSNGIRLRTARMGDVVVVARLDAAIWNESAEVMRAKLAPPRQGTS